MSRLPTFCSRLGQAGQTARLTLLIAVLVLGGEALAAGNFYCCNDPAGKQVCGDILPQACIGRPHREVGESGMTIRHIDAPLTAEQRAQRAVEEERQKIEEERRKEQQRKDQALINTYGNEKDIEVMRKRAEADVYQSVKNAESKIVEIKTLRKKFENEAEFYKKKALPPEIQKGFRDTDFEIKAQESVIDAKKKELEIIRLKYDDDLRRYQDLTRRGVRR
ncbi:MAG: hypothetical protein WCK63_00995 [Betaproteobacteria bacterium]